MIVLLLSSISPLNAVINTPQEEMQVQMEITKMINTVIRFYIMQEVPQETDRTPINQIINSDIKSITKTSKKVPSDSFFVYYLKYLNTKIKLKIYISSNNQFIRIFKSK